MQVKTILNRIQKHRGFVYGTVQLEEQMAGLALTVDIAPHRRNRPRLIRESIEAKKLRLKLHAAPEGLRSVNVNSDRPGSQTS
jgi:hypothetical protein